MNTPILYFAYGSNLNPKRITRRCPTAATFRTAKLRNYRLVERLYADIDYEEGTVVHGVLKGRTGQLGEKFFKWMPPHTRQMCF